LRPVAIDRREAFGAIEPRSLLVVQERADARSGQLLLFDGKQLRTYRPEDYRLF
jgi:hypothetical protein